MTALVHDGTVDFTGIFNAPERIGITELARNSEGWKSRLSDRGLLEITDRSGTAAFLISEDSLRKIADAFEAQERELERLSIEAMFATRGEHGQWMSGEALAQTAEAALTERFS